MKPRHLLITEARYKFLAESLSDIFETRYVPFTDLCLEDLAWADSWVGTRPPITPAASNIRWFHVGTVGVDLFHELFDDFIATGARLTHTVGTMPHRIGEFVVATVLAHVRELNRFKAQENDAEWWPGEDESAMGMRAVVIGTGRIGSATARLLQPFVGRVDGLSRSGRHRAGFETVRALGDPGDLLEKANIVVVVLPKTPETAHVINADVFGQMAGAIFVNVGRGVTVDHEALRVALRGGQVSHAILDVFDTEPLPAGDWCWSHPRVDVFPHTSGRLRSSDVEDDLRAAYVALVGGADVPGEIDLSGWY